MTETTRPATPDSVSTPGTADPSSRAPADRAGPPPRDGLQQLVEQVAPGASITGVQALTGGGRSTHEVMLEHGDRRWAIVVRRASKPDAFASLQRHYERLGALRKLDLPVPEPILVDDGTLFGLPALVMSRLPGRPELAPPELHDWANRMGEMLARIHSADSTAVPHLNDAGHELPRPWLRPVQQRATAATFPWGQRAWDTFHASPPAPSTHVLVHSDFQSTNVLWSAGAISGVVDWVMPCTAAAGAEVGEARFDAMLLFGPEVADQLLHAYEAARGTTVTDIDKWDVRAAIVLGLVVDIYSWFTRYNGQGRHDLTLGVLEQRLNDWVTPKVR